MIGLWRLSKGGGSPGQGLEDRHQEYIPHKLLTCRSVSSFYQELGFQLYVLDCPLFYNCTIIVCIYLFSSFFPLMVAYKSSFCSDLCSSGLFVDFGSDVL